MTRKLNVFVKRQVNRLKAKLKAKKLEYKIYLNSAETFTNHIHLCKEAINYLSDRIYQLENEKELTR